MSKIQTIEIKDIENVKLEKMRYQKNSLSYILGFAGIIFSILAAVIGLNTLKPSPMFVIKILMNIGILLFGFLTCEKVKTYKLGYGYTMFGFAAICIARIFWFPLLMITNWSKFNKGDVVGAQKVLGAQIFATDKQYQGYMFQNCYGRAAVCIILLITSAAFFAFSGYVAVKKTKKLNNYLASINVKSENR